MYKGRHLLVDCRNVAREVCLNDKLVLNAMARAAERAGATVVSQVRYKFGQDSPPDSPQWLCWTRAIALPIPMRIWD